MQSQLTLLFLSIGLLLGASCGGGDDAGSSSPTTGGEDHGHGHHGHGGHDEHGEMHPALDAFHDVLAPVWHSEPGEGRAAQACAAVATMAERAGPVADAVRQADPAASAGSDLMGAVDTLQQDCAALSTGGAAETVETTLTAVHTAFHDAMAAMGEDH